MPNIIINILYIYICVCACFIFKHSLAVLDAVIRYSSLPSTALHSFVVAVCNTVNVEKFCEPSWRVSEYNDSCQTSPYPNYYTYEKKIFFVTVFSRPPFFLEVVLVLRVFV